MCELWDAFDINLNLIEDMTLVRGERIPDGVYHLVCDIAVKHTDGMFLLMKRDINKHLGGMWQLTAGGAALKGERPIECAKRELFEETGIISNNLLEIGRVAEKEHHSFYVEYLCLADCNKKSIVLQEGDKL